MWMPLVDVSLPMGPIRFATGSHRQGYRGHFPISPEAQEVYEEQLTEGGYPRWQAPMKAGDATDATFHNGWIVHGASANLTEQLRSAMIVTYYPDGTRCGEFQNPSHEGDAKGFLGGVQPGDLCDNDATNPVVWRARPSL